jgi:glycosyltransferase involved in cell wall biosynthesis
LIPEPYSFWHSTTRLLTLQRPALDDSPNAKFTSILFLPESKGRKGDGGLRTKGYFKEQLLNKPLISVIVAVFNGEKTLEKTLLSVFNQTYDNVELIIIDGGSTDGTIDIIKQHEGQIDYWVSESDLGIYDAWNKGVKLAHGEWIAFLGTGDTYNPSAISIYVTSILASKIALDFISSHINLVDQNGKILRLHGVPFVWNEVRKAMDFAHVGALHNRSLFERFGLFDILYKSAGDYEFFMRCGRELRTVFMDTVTVDVLVGGISLNSCVGLQETCDIQKKYGVHPLFAYYKYWLVRLKQKVRPYIRGY